MDWISLSLALKSNPSVWDGAVEGGMYGAAVGAAAGLIYWFVKKRKKKEDK